MSFYIQFETNRKSEVFDDVKSIMLLNNITVLIFEDESVENLQLSNVIGITPYFYNEG